MARTLVVWRHGQTDHNASGIWQGQLDTHLSEVGRAQVAAAAAALAASYHPSHIWSSDLVRAAETARALARIVQVDIRYDERLREIDAGLWQGMTAGDVEERFPQESAALAAGEDLPRGGHGETVAQVAERARAAVDELLAQLAPDGCAVVSTHGVSGRAVAGSLVGLSQADASMALGGLGNCRWAVLAEGRRGWRITQWNAGA